MRTNKKALFGGIRETGSLTPTLGPARFPVRLFETMNWKKAAPGQL
jgi:hypothetical protein